MKNVPKRSVIARDLFTPKYKSRVIPNKKRKNIRSKVRSFPND